LRFAGIKPLRVHVQCAPAIRPFEIDHVIDQMVDNTAQSQFRVSPGVAYRWSFTNRKDTTQSFLRTAQPPREMPRKPSDNPMLAITPGDAENHGMLDDQATPAAAARKAAFAPGAAVLVTLSSPREKFWGVLLEVSAAGLSLRGLDLNSFEDFVHLVRAGEPASPAAVFFPMHRVERMEADEHSGDIPSLKERFQEKTGRPLAYLFGRYGE
jgi:hypothetical protein